MKALSGILICLACALSDQALHASGAAHLLVTAPADRIVTQAQTRTAAAAGAQHSIDATSSPHIRLVNVRVERCNSYPYGTDMPSAESARILLRDLADGLATGLQCLSGQGPMGPLHPYHRREAERLVALFTSPRPKTFACVEDTMFATAVATGPGELPADDPLYAQLSEVQFPAVVLDTHRLGGLLSRHFDDATYRDFFHLGDEQILEHKTGHPLRADSLHRYQDRGALLFHEVVHWLGHQHSAIYPDVAHLYETCCFGGSDYISDPSRNIEHQQTACAILKDAQLWADGNSPNTQMRLWRLKGYDRLKTRMRADYAH